MNEKTMMIKYFENAGIELTSSQQDKFFTFYQMLKQYNREFDLSRLIRFEDIMIKHFIDSVYVTRLTELPPSLVDIGTGPGFPGIPLKIISPETRIILAEPRHKRVKFMHMVIDRLKLKNIEVYPHLVTEKSFFEVDGVITRALESIDETMTRTDHFLPENGRILFMKGPEADKDIDKISEQNSLHYKPELDTSYTLPGTDNRRRLIIYRKTVNYNKKTYRIFHDENETIGFPITSPDNKKFREIKKLTAIEGIKKSESMTVSGKKIIIEILKRENLQTEKIIIYDGYSEDNDFLNRKISDFNETGNLIILKKSLFNEIDTFNTGNPVLVVKKPGIKEWNGSDIKSCVPVIAFQDPVNVGAVMRTACGFGVKKCILLKESASPFHPRAVRSSSGAVFSMELLSGPSINNLAEIASENSLDFVALHSDGEDIQACNFPDNFLLLPGIEGPGLPESLKGKTVSIPISDDIESLNGAVAASIALYEWKKKQG